mgnify:FL=1
MLERIQMTVDSEPDMSRRELSRRVCRWLDWRSADGRIQDMSCRKALLRLHRSGAIVLPRQETTYGFEKASKASIDYESAPLHCSITDLGSVVVEPVRSRYCKESRIWNALMDQYHYLGSGPLCGAQIRYIVKSTEHGYLGALAFSSATWALRSRDEYIGWTETARRANLHRIVGNDRFLILPGVRVKNLASYVLSRVISRLPGDWMQRYNVYPVAVETFVDPQRFSGTCYRAANWVCIGHSAGRRDGVPKKVFFYPLCCGWRDILCDEPQFQLGDGLPVEAPASWAEAEFGTIRLHDDRLKQRLYTMAGDFYNNPEANIPEACGSKAATMGAYRFFQNKKVTMDIVLDAHTEATINRIKQHRVVLAPQDTTTLNYTTHPMTQGLGPVCHINDSSIGLILHDTLAFSEEGTPLGVVDAQCWARDEKQGKRHKRKQLPIEQKESMKWLRSFRKLVRIQQLCPETMLISIGDRESDIYELFLEAAKTPEGPKLLVRADNGRQRKADQQFLWDRMNAQQLDGSLKIHLPRRGSAKARDTWVDIRYGPVCLQPPKNSAGADPVQVWAVYIVEKPEHRTSAPPIEWMLLTTAAVEDFADAKKRVEWYSGRWGIEVYHRTLKSGCRIKDRQLHNADRLEACLGIDMVVAWRIYHLTMLGRETPEMACTVFFKDVEWKALCCYVNKSPIPPKKPPTLQEAIAMVGSIGGHLGRKSDGSPGTQTLWRGIQRLETATEMYVIFTQHDSPHPFQSGP